jgi:signal transduction histidine kinase/CheY-like chemotaxis protein
MTIEPEVLRSEQYVEVGRVIQRDMGALVERWARRAVREQPKAARAHHQALLDHLPRFLHTLGQCLAENTDPDAAPQCAAAGEHGAQRWQEGWSLPEVVRDYQILRLVIFEYLEETLDRPILFREALAVGLALDEAIGASVQAYIRQRDEEVRRVAADLREQAEALRESDRHKNEFLAMLAHELRNPLAPILTSVEVLRLLGPAEGGTAQARDILERQVRQMVRLVDDLLDVTRVAQGKLELRRSTFELARAVQQAVLTTRPLFESQGHRLSVELPEQPLYLEADEARVVQIMVNLLTNAGKYTERGGRVTLTADREGDEVVIRVRDNGVGIEPEMLGRVFDLFTQVGRSRHRSQGGLGIGLTLVRQLVELHSGRVTVHSDGPSEGSEFTVRLPAAAGRPEPSAPPSPGLPAAERRRILIIEENPDARETLATLLQMLGHHTATARTGPEGLAQARAARPQVVLVDLGLPGLDGLEVARQLRADLGASVRLVAVTGHALEEDRRKTREAGFDAHLAKPVELEELNRVLAAAG